MLFNRKILIFKENSEIKIILLKIKNEIRINHINQCSNIIKPRRIIN